MDELLTELSANGFSIPSIQLNGQLSRFDRAGNKSAWFVGFETKTKKGEPFIVAVYGDWKTGERYEYKTKREYSKSENSEILKRIADAQARAERERESLQESAKREAERIWSAGGENPGCDYISRKSIDSLYGTRTILREDGRILLVPMRDSGGELWGLQQVYSGGKKYFLTGQRINGLFHVVGPGNALDITDVIYIGEGFATCASIHQATKKPVIVAFNAQNLVHVAKELKEKYPTTSFVICGDDDQFTERDGQPYNPGREYAEKAAKACSGRAVFPKFSSLAAQPTDFNDLHILEGLDAVKHQVIGGAPVDRQYVLCLGFNAEKYFYTSSQNNFIKGITAANHSKLNLLSLMDLSYWQNVYPAKNDDEVDWTLAFNDLMDKCRKKGPFNLNNVRATGAWLGEKSELIINRGDCLIVDGKKVGFHSVKSRYIYEPSDMTIPEPGTDFLSDEASRWFLETISMLRWAHADYYKYLCGWLVIAPMCGALEWRPHIWLSGPSGSGKSTVMSEVAHRIMRKRALLFQGQSTEAGVRQAIGKKSVPVIFDEFETNDEKSGQRVSQTIELLRQASFESDAYITKGSSLGESVSYTTRTCALVASINVNLINEADKNRFTVCELMRGFESQQMSMRHFTEFQSRVSKITDEWIELFHARIIRNWEAFTHNRKMLFTFIAEKYSSRLAQQYSVLLAGYQLLQSTEKLTSQLGALIVDDCDLEFKLKESEESDEMECLRFIMSKTTFVNGPINQDISHYELIDGATRVSLVQDNYVDSARRLGFIVREGNLLVINNHPHINEILKGTKWVGTYNRSLLRIKGADNNGNKPVYANGSTHKVVRIPLAIIKPS